MILILLFAPVVIPDILALTLFFSKSYIPLVINFVIIINLNGGGLQHNVVHGEDMCVYLGCLIYLFHHDDLLFNNNLRFIYYLAICFIHTNDHKSVPINNHKLFMIYA